MDNIEFGIDTFGDLPRDDRGEIVSYAEAIRRVVAEAVLADEIGLDVIAVLRAVELYGTRVVPLVREMLAEQPVAGGSR